MCPNLVNLFAAAGLALAALYVGRRQRVNFVTR